MLVELSLAEEKALAELAAKKGLSSNGVIRQALRLYQLASVYQEQGIELAWTKKGRLVNMDGPKKSHPLTSDESKG